MIQNFDKTTASTFPSEILITVLMTLSFLHNNQQYRLKAYN